MVGSSQQHLLQRKGKTVAEKGATTVTAVEEKVVVAVKAATREISKTAIVWALTHVVQPGGSILVLVVIPAHTSGNYAIHCYPLLFGSVFGFCVCYIRIRIPISALVHACLR